MDRNLGNMQRPRERGTETQKWGWVGVAERERDRQAVKTWKSLPDTEGL